MIGRRTFFRAAVSAPLAAKAAADKAIAEACGINGNASGFSQPSGTYSDPHLAKAFALVQAFGVPQFDRDRLWQECQYVASLDPDLAAKRSWSMSVKIATQRQRNFERRLTYAKRTLEWGVARDAFSKLNGFPWMCWF